MNTAIPQEVLDTIFDEVARQVTETVAGIRLFRGNTMPNGEIYTVYSAFERGFCSSLSLSAEASVFIRLTQNIMENPQVTQQDVEDFTKEYFNVLCGNIASKLFQITKVASRFEIPSFRRGHYQPENHQDELVIHYSSDKNEGVQLTHHTLVME